MPTYSKEQLNNLFDQLPEELQETIFSLDTSENILNVCRTYGLLSEEVGQISECVGQVLMGLLPPSDFQKEIQGRVGIPEVLAGAVTREINRFIFYPVKPSLEEIYKIEISTSETPVEKAKQAEETEKTGEQTEIPQKKDVYREPIE